LRYPFIVWLQKCALRNQKPISMDIIHCNPAQEFQEQRNLPQKKQATNDRSPLEKLIAILQDGASKGKKKGWYLKELRVTDKEKKRLSNVETQRLWTEVQLLESYLNYSQSRKQRWKKNNITGKFMKSSATSKALTTTYLVETAYGRGNLFLLRLRKKARGSDGSISSVIPPKGKKNDHIDRHRCIIEDREMAKSKYTAKHLYALNARRDDLAKFSTQSREAHRERYKKAADEYDELETDSTKRNWEMVAREHDEQQPNIKNRIIEALKANPKVSWQALEETIQHWCSASTIWRWVTSLAGYKCYCPRKGHIFNSLVTFETIGRGLEQGSI
jgi:hypothetical protein